MFDNKYNSVKFRVVCVNKKNPSENEVLGDVKLKKNKLSFPLLKHVRSAAIKFSGKEMNADWPTDCKLEIRVLGLCSKMLKNYYKSRYTTTVREDKKLLSDNITEHKKYAVILRMEAKEILISNITLLELLIKILNRVAEGKSFKKAYMEKVSELEVDNEFYVNRIAIRRYLRSCYYYMCKS